MMLTASRRGPWVVALILIIAVAAFPLPHVIAGLVVAVAAQLAYAIRRERRGRAR